MGLYTVIMKDGLIKQNLDSSLFDLSNENVETVIRQSAFMKRKYKQLLLQMKFYEDTYSDSDKEETRLIQSAKDRGSKLINCNCEKCGKVIGRFLESIKVCCECKKKFGIVNF